LKFIVGDPLANPPREMYTSFVEERRQVEEINLT